jgi:hypothetical protein
MIRMSLMYSSSDVKRLVLHGAILVEVTAMKASNAERIADGLSIAYNESHFWGKAEELRVLASLHPDQL